MNLVVFDRCPIKFKKIEEFQKSVFLKETLFYVFRNVYLYEMFIDMKDL